jgi:hypothetical protein
MADDRNQKGPQAHAEGQHGTKTHSAFIDSLHGRHGGSEESEGVPETGSPYGETSSDGRHRLTEDRQQHDEAEKNSEGMKSAREKGTERDHHANGR